MQIIGKWTGRVYDLEHRDGDPKAKNPFQRPYWTYSYLSDVRNPCGELMRLYCSVGYLSERHLTPALAAWALDRSDIIAASTEGGPLSRNDYLRECKRFRVQALSDDECDSYGVKYGNFYGFGYPTKTCVEMALAYRRLKAIEACREEARKLSPTPAQPWPPAQTGQLWEPCENCGREPVYMPLHVCDECWPK